MRANGKFPLEIDIGLRLLHPLMPFITEELYQRLPRRDPTKDPPSICVTPFPAIGQYTEFGRDEALEGEIEFVDKILHAVRLLRWEYNLAKTRVLLYLRFDAESGLLDKMKPYLDTIKVSFICECFGSGVWILGNSC